MWTRLQNSVQSLTQRYGAEAAFVGRVALKALLPPGADSLLTAGCEALFEYIDSKSGDPINEEELHQHLTQHHLPVGPLNQSLIHLNEHGQEVLDRIHQTHQSGYSETDINQMIQQHIAQDPTLQQLKYTFEGFAKDLQDLKNRTSVLISGQSYQTQLIEEMLSLVKGALREQHIPSLNQLSSLIDSSVSSAVSKSSSPSLTLSSPRPSLANPLQNELIPTSSPSSSPVLSPHLAQLTQARFKHSKTPKKTPQKTQTASIHLSSENSLSSHVCKGEGDFIFYLIKPGQDHIRVIKWLCEHLYYSLSEALILIQSTPCPIYKSSDFVLLARWQKELKTVGITCKFKRP